MTVTVKIENAYADGHESEREVEVMAPHLFRSQDPYHLNEWWEEVVWPKTGDGHGIDAVLGSCYVATIITADDPNLVGATYEWMD